MRAAIAATPSVPEPVSDALPVDACGRSASTGRYTPTPSAIRSAATPPRAPATSAITATPALIHGPVRRAR
ncbi:hypothetical protein [Paraoerskovia sediminicola]|uniref:hypothetical protein n=1 Tax=Paraoerskovia sediminicola TaxID=1138587 RepID=UPI002572E39C|nr:hypothetical protein [Paraoerskovia sediminicola]